MRQPVVEALPAGPLGGGAERRARLEDFRLLQVGGEVVDGVPGRALSERDDVEREVDCGVHPRLLRSPGSAEDGVGRAGRVGNGAGFHLSEKAAKVADQVGI